MPKKISDNVLVADKVGQGVDVEIDGAKFTLLLSNRNIIEIENETGLVILTNPQVNLGMPTGQMMATVLHFMLKRAGADVSLDHCIDLAANNPTEIHATIVAAWLRSMPSEEQIKILDPSVAAIVAPARAQMKAAIKGLRAK